MCKSGCIVRTHNDFGFCCVRVRKEQQQQQPSSANICRHNFPFGKIIIISIIRTFASNIWVDAYILRAKRRKIYEYINSENAKQSDQNGDGRARKKNKQKKIYIIRKTCVCLCMRVRVRVWKVNTRLRIDWFVEGYSYTHKIRTLNEATTVHTRFSKILNLIHT